MKIRKFDLIALLIITSFLIQIYTSKEIIQITDDNLRNHIKKDNFLIIFISDHWEPDQQIKDKFYSIAKKIHSDSNFNNIIISETDLTSYKICREYKIYSPNTIILVQNDEFSKYNGIFEEGLIFDWIKRIIDRKTKHLANFEDLNHEFEDHGIMVLFYGNVNENILQHENFFKVSNSLTNVNFYNFENRTILQEMNFDLSLKIPSILIIKSFDERFKIYSETDFSENTLLKFISIFSKPILAPLDSDEFVHDFRAKINFITLINHDNYSEHAKTLVKVFYKSLSYYRSEFNGYSGSFDDFKHSVIKREFNVFEEETPLILVQKYINNSPKRFKSNRLSKPEDITSFFEDLKSNKLKQYLKSEPIKSDHQIFEENVYKLVGDNFLEHILNEKVFAFVIFTRENCSLCNQLENGFNKIAKITDKKSPIIFAKINGELNEFEGIDIEGYPTFILFSQGKNKLENFVKFTDVPTFDNMKNFLSNRIKQLIFVKDEF